MRTPATCGCPSCVLSLAQRAAAMRSHAACGCPSCIRFLASLTEDEFDGWLTICPPAPIVLPPHEAQVRPIEDGASVYQQCVEGVA